MHPRTLYASKCYWPGVNVAEAARATRRSVLEHRSTSAAGVECLGAIVFPLDDLVLGFFNAASPGDVRHASEQAGMPCERVMQAVWLSGHRDQPLLANEAETTGDATDASHGDRRGRTNERTGRSDDHP